MAPVDRFLSFVFHDASGCWLWVGGKDREGYGMYWHKGRTGRATHFALECIKLSTKKPGQLAMHTCDNPSCVNPSHLVWGTQKENIQDCISKGRRENVKPPHRAGEDHPTAKLTNEQVRWVRAQYRPWRVTAVQLAKRLGVSVGTVKQIVQRKSWRHLNALG